MLSNIYAFGRTKTHSNKLTASPSSHQAKPRKRHKTKNHNEVQQRKGKQPENRGTEKRHPKLGEMKPAKRPEKVNRQSERPSAREKREKPRKDRAKSGRNYTLPKILACPELDWLLLRLH